MAPDEMDGAAIVSSLTRVPIIHFYADHECAVVLRDF